MRGLLEKVHCYPVLSFFLLAYAIPWSAILAIVGVDGLRSGDLGTSKGMLVWAAMLAGPSISGVLLMYVVAGRAGMRDFRDRLLRWRVPRRWYATLLITPVIGSIVFAGLSAISSDFKPMLVVESTVIVIVMFVVLVFGAAVEELGWTGYVTPRLRIAHGLLGAGLLLGTLHGAWHFLADFSGRSDAAPLLYYPRFVIFWIVGLVALRMLMIWVYEHTESLLLGQLIHASYTAPLFLLTPPNASAAQILLLWTAFTVIFLAVVAGLVFGTKGIAGKQPRQTIVSGQPPA